MFLSQFKKEKNRDNKLQLFELWNTPKIDKEKYT